MKFRNIRLKSYWKTGSGKLAGSFTVTTIPGTFSLDDTGYELQGPVYRGIAKTREELESETDSYLQPD